jgi:HNH endonuclease/NUMOD4 motif
MRDETWRPVPGFEGLYEVSNFGRVRSLGRPSRNGIRSFSPRMLRPGPSNYGHLSVVLGRRNTRMVHQLVLQAFVGSRPLGMEVRHLDGDPTNNRLENLCWGTRTENIHDAMRHGTWESEKRKAGRARALPKLIVGLVKARAAQTMEDRIAALARGRQTRWGRG